jgi:hypothetical protein
MSELARFNTSVDVTTDKTLALIDSGIVQNTTVDGKVYTLPATAIGLCFTIRNGGDNATSTAAGAVADGSTIVTISPQAGDKISGMGLTPQDNKDLINTKATSRVGDFVTLLADGVDGYTVIAVRGTWVRES